MPDTSFSATLLSSAADLSATDWNGLAPGQDGRPDNPFLDHAFFDALEKSGSASRETGWLPQHLLLRDAQDMPVGLMPLYLKSHSQGEYVFDYGWADAFQRAGGAYYPKFQASVPFTPATGPRLLAHDTETRQALLQAISAIAEDNDISSVHATFVPEEEQKLAEEAGWLVRYDTQYHWFNQGFSSFENYLESMSSRHRKVTRRERREALSSGIEVRWLTGADLTESVWDAFFDFYTDTGNRKWGRPYLNRRFFSLLTETMADRIVLMFAYDGDEPIAGTLSLVGRERLFGRYWGASRDVPFLHFELCYYQAIDYAIAHGLKVAEAGAQGDHKLARGYTPTTTRSVHWVGHPGLRNAVADFLEQERVAVSREQEALRRYTPFRHNTGESGES
ncbi:GNAT family N-acetyltransferase [Devosia sp.]|uniref:GNAT family N-acetyltransferase n=1 Tax=Devosia sp. TaxID=1871048 RepID=UPI003A9162AB